MFARWMLPKAGKIVSKKTKDLSKLDIAKKELNIAKIKAKSVDIPVFVML